MQAWATAAVPEFSGPINAVANAAATLGAVVSPGLVGVVADATDIALAMWLLPVFMAGLLVLALVVVARSERPPAAGS
jgi:fucose permease